MKPLKRPGARAMGPWGMVEALGFVTCLATLCGFCGAWAWFLDLFAHFRVQYLLILSVLAALFALRHLRRRALVFGVFACINLATMAPLYIGNPAGSGFNLSAPVIKAVILNVSTELGSVEAIERLVRRTAPDLVLLQEVNGAWMARLKGLEQILPHVSAEPREDNFGIALFSRYPFTREETLELGESGVPTLRVDVAAPQGTCIVIGTHPVPPASRIGSRLRDDQLAQLASLAAEAAATSPVLLVGDLNTTPWGQSFRALLKHSGLQDSSRGRGVRPTWPTWLPLFWIPLDHCLYSDRIAVIEKTTGPYVGSDHYPVLIQFTIVQPRSRSP